MGEEFLSEYDLITEERQKLQRCNKFFFFCAMSAAFLFVCLFLVVLVTNPLKIKCTEIQKHLASFVCLTIAVLGCRVLLLQCCVVRVLLLQCCVVRVLLLQCCVVRVLTLFCVRHHSSWCLRGEKSVLLLLLKAGTACVFIHCATPSNTKEVV